MAGWACKITQRVVLNGDSPKGRWGEEVYQDEERVEEEEEHRAILFTC